MSRWSTRLGKHMPWNVVVSCWRDWQGQWCIVATDLERASRLYDLHGCGARGLSTFEAGNGRYLQGSRLEPIPPAGHSGIGRGSRFLTTGRDGVEGARGSEATVSHTVGNKEQDDRSVAPVKSRIPVRKAARETRPRKVVGIVLKVLGRPWEPEVAQQLADLDLKLGSGLVHEVLVARKHDPKLALEFFMWARAQGYAPGVHDYYILLSGCVRAGEIGSAQVVLEDMLGAGHPMSLRIFRLLFYAFSATKRGDLALAAMDQMEAFHCKPDAGAYHAFYNAVIGEESDLPVLFKTLAAKGHFAAPEHLYCFLARCRSSGNVGHAGTLYRLLKEEEVKLSSNCYAMLLMFVAKAGLKEEAANLYKEGKAAGWDDQSERCRNMFVEYLAQVGDLNEARKLIDRSLEQGIRIRAPVGTKAILAFGSAGRIKEASALYHDLRKGGSRFREERDVKPLLSLFCKGFMAEACDISAAESIWVDLKKLRKPSVDLCSTVIEIMGKGPRGDAVMWAVYQEVRRSGLDIEDPETYDVLMHRFCETGKVDEALRLVKEMWEKQLDCHADLYKMLVHRLAKEGKTSVLGDLIASMKEKQVSMDGSFYEVLAEGLCEAGKLQDAEDVLKRVSGLGEELQSRIYAAMIRGFGKVGDKEAGLRLFERSQGEEGLQEVVVYNAALHTLASTGRADEVLTFYENMKQKGLALDVASYTAVIRCLGDTDRFLEASNLFTEMKRNGCVPTSDTYQVLSEMPPAAFKMIMM